MFRLGVRADVREVTRYLTRVQKRQVPFATSQALNRTAWDTRAALQKGIARDLDRPTPFTVKGIQMRRASKSRLVSAVFIEQKRWAYLQYQVEGGTRRPSRKVLLIGASGARRNQYGNVSGFRKIRSKLLARPNHFEGEINGTAGIWRTYKRKPPKLVVLYAEDATYRPRFRFYERAAKAAQARFPTHFRRELAAALRTAR